MPSAVEAQSLSQGLSYFCSLLTSFCCCSVAKSCPTLCDPVNCSMPGFPVLHYLPEFAQTHVHWVSDAIQPSHPLSHLNLFFDVFKWNNVHLGGSNSKVSACSGGDPGSIPGLGRSPGEGKGYPLQYSCLENPMDRGTWGYIVHGATKSWEWLSN